MCSLAVCSLIDLAEVSWKPSGCRIPCSFAGVAVARAGIRNVLFRRRAENLDAEASPIVYSGPQQEMLKISDFRVMAVNVLGGIRC